MSEEINNVQKTRRSAIKTAAQVAVTAPAVGLLLSASTKAASAVTTYATSQTGDDHVVKTIYYDDGAQDDVGTSVLISGDDTF
jgi:hypothetical protein